jgi:hypothetical protein
MLGTRVHSRKSLALVIMREEAHDMRTAPPPIRQLLSLVGMGLMVAGLFGCLTLPGVSAVGEEPFAYQNDWGVQSRYGYQHPWEQRDYWGQRDLWGHQHDRPSRRPRYGLPDRYTIHKGKKCELQCERIRGTREYSCREYRC